MSIQDIVKGQKNFFNTDKTLAISYRKQALLKLQQAIELYELEIYEALRADLNKSQAESYMTEIAMVKQELEYTLRNLKKWSRPKRATTPIIHFPSKAYIHKEPYGVSLIIAPWNYPFQLCLVPLISAIAAGNCAVIKPSAYAPNVSSLIAKMIESTFLEEYITVVEGGREENSQLLEQNFDFIFFTGSTEVGKVVMQAASKNLTPVCLELGGKSPAIIDNTKHIDLYAKRIVFGKFINSGQTCVAPDYVLVHENVRGELVESLKKHIIEMYGAQPLLNEDMPKIINKKHFDRLMHLMENQNIAIGGKSDPNKMLIEPTVLVDVSYESAIMQEEIFGPILPIISYVYIEDVVDKLKKSDKPLALYVFSENKRFQEHIINTLSYGGGCINDTIIHLSATQLPFGGVGASGMGAYHGKSGFDTFSHTKSILHKGLKPDIALRYPPYSNEILRVIKKLF